MIVEVLPIPQYRMRIPSGIQRPSSVFIADDPHKQLLQTKLDGRLALSLASLLPNTVSSDATESEIQPDRARMKYGFPTGTASLIIYSKSRASSSR